MNEAFKKRPLWQQAIIILLLLALFMVLERQLQNYLGRRAIAYANLPEQGLPEALAKAAQDGKPVLANFSALWCPSCRKLDREVLANPSVRQKILDEYHYTRLEYEDPEQAKWFAQFGIGGFPVLIVMQGQSYRQLALTFEPEDFIRQL